MFKLFINYYKYLKFNKLNLKSKTKSNSLILVEFSYLKSFVFSNSYFSHVLSNLYNSKIYFYYPNFLNLNQKIKFFFQKINPLSNYYLYKSFSDKLIVPKKKENFNYKLTSKKFNQLKNNSDLVNLKYRDIQIGDLIYDEFLASQNCPTIDIKSDTFKKFFFSIFELIYFWEDFFFKNCVKSIIISHSVYIMGLVGRIGISNDIKVYVIGPTSHYKLTKKKFIKWSDHNEYQNNFKNFTRRTQKKLLIEAKKNLNLRLSGKKDFRYKMARPINPVFLNSKINIRKYKANIKKNILIAAHCFMDAPHVYGDILFNDFHEWIEFLGKKTLSNKFNKNINFYIKVHPSLYEQNIKIFEKFVIKYPKFKLVDKNETHNNLIGKLGIDYVLTVYGSIAHEYPLYKIPVINAGINPHMGYEFSLTPKNKKEYEKVLNNLGKSKKNIKFENKKIFEFYAMHHLLDYNFFEDLEITQNLKSSSIDIFSKFMDKINSKIHYNKIDNYKKFIQSNSRRLIDIEKWK